MVQPHFFHPKLKLRWRLLVSSLVTAQRVVKLGLVLLVFSSFYQWLYGLIGETDRQRAGAASAKSWHVNFYAPSYYSVNDDRLIWRYAIRDCSRSVGTTVPWDCLRQQRSSCLCQCWPWPGTAECLFHHHSHWKRVDPERKWLDWRFCAKLSSSSSIRRLLFTSCRLRFYLRAIE